MTDLERLLKRIYTDGTVGNYRKLSADAEAIRKLVISEQMAKARASKQQKV